MNERKSVLFVDDDPTMLLLIKAITNQSLPHLETIVAPDGQTAFQIVTNRKIDCVVTDIQMPELNGLELLEKIVKFDKSIPVIVLAKYDQLQNVRTAWKHGAFDFLKKPIEKEQVVETLETALHYRSMFNPSIAIDRSQLFWKDRYVSEIVLDKKMIEELFCNDSIAIFNILQEFQSSAYEKMSELKMALTLPDEQIVLSCIHFLIGACHNIFAKEFATMLESIQTSLDEGHSITESDVRYLKERFKALDKEITEYSQAIQSIEKAS